MKRYQVERFCVWLVRSAARVLPRKLVLLKGSLFGEFVYLIDHRHRQVAFQNFRIAFPDSTTSEMKATIRRTYRFFGMYLFDMLTFLPSFQPERMRDIEYEGLEHVKAAYARKKGVLLFGGHCGAWELMGVGHGYCGFSMGVTVRRLDNPYLEDLLQRFRQSTGNFVIDKKEGFRPMLKALREGKGVAILIDQNVVTDDRIFVNFFGKAASTTPALALLKLKTDACLIPVFALPLPGSRYRFIYGAPVEVPLSGDRQKDVYKITQECTAVIEQQIRNYPEYWLWMHRRWKTRPETEVEAAHNKFTEEVSA